MCDSLCCVNVHSTSHILCVTFDGAGGLGMYTVFYLPQQDNNKEQLNLCGSV